MATTTAPAPLAALAGGFGLTVLSQTLLLGALPLVGALVEPRSGLSALPSAALLAGAALGALPAAFLSRRFGASIALACGALAGASGGALLAFALLHGSFLLAILGAGLLGGAQGAGALYRHAGFAAGQGSWAPALVFGAGASAGFLGPQLAALAEAAWSPRLFVGTVLVATLAHLGALTLAVALPHAAPPPAPRAPARPEGSDSILAPTLAGALAWAAMTSLMVSTPLAMAACGISPAGAGGAIAWHVVAMYLPAAMATPLMERLGPQRTVGIGLSLTLAAGTLFAGAQTTIAFSAALFILGAGWGLTTLATSAWLHRGNPSPSGVARHDAALFAAALLGALAAPLLAG